MLKQLSPWVVDQTHCESSVTNIKATALVFVNDVVILSEVLWVLMLVLEALHEEARPLGLLVFLAKILIQVIRCLLDESVQSGHRVARTLRSKKALHILAAWYIAAVHQVTRSRSPP